MTQCERDELTLLINGVYQLVPYSAVKCITVFGAFSGVLHIKVHPPVNLTLLKCSEVQRSEVQ